MREILWSEDALAHMSTGRPGRGAGAYEKVVSGIPYIVAYAIDAAPGGRDSSTVLRIIHTARNWPEGGWPQD